MNSGENLFVLIQISKYVNTETGDAGFSIGFLRVYVFPRLRWFKGYKVSGIISPVTGPALRYILIGESRCGHGDLRSAARFCRQKTITERKHTSCHLQKRLSPRRLRIFIATKRIPV